MGPFDWIKNKVGAGISDIGGAISSGVHDVENAFGGNNSAPAAAPSQSQTGGGGSISIAQPSNPSISIAKTAPAPAGPNAITINNSNPQASAAQTGIQGGPTPVVSGVHSVGDINNALNNPEAKIQSGNPTGATPTASQVVTGQTPNSTPKAQPANNNGLIQLAAEQPKGIPLSSAPNSTPVQSEPAPQPQSTSFLGHVGNVFKQGGSFVGDVAKGAYEGTKNTITGDIVEPTRAIVGQVTGNTAAENAANARAAADQNASLPMALVRNVGNIGAAGYNLMFKAPIEGIMDPNNPNAGGQAATTGLREFNQTTPGAVAAPFERLLANLGGKVNSTTETSAGIQQDVGLDPAQSLTKQLLNSGLNATMLGDPAYGLGSKFAETGVGQSLLEQGAKIPDVMTGIRDNLEPLAGNEIGAVGRNVKDGMTPADTPEPIDVNPPKSVGDILAERQGATKIAPEEAPTTNGLQPEQQQIVQQYADGLRQMETGMTGGYKIPSAEEGYIRASDHTPFYRDFYAENGHAPRVQDWLDEAEHQLRNGTADGYAQDVYDGISRDIQNPEVRTLINSPHDATPISDDEANERAAQEFEQSVPKELKTSVAKTGMSAPELDAAATPIDHVMANTMGTSPAVEAGVRIAKQNGYARAADAEPGVVLRETRPNVEGGNYQTVELIKNPRTGEYEQTTVDHVNGQRFPRNAAGERAALEALQNGGIREDAIRAYQEAVPGTSDRDARFAVQRAAADAGVALKPNARGDNPIAFSLPKVSEGDYGKARSNPQVVRSLIENRGLEEIRAVRSLGKDVDKSEFWHAVEDGRPTGNAKLDNAIAKWRSLADTVHATDVGSGGSTPYIQNYAMHDWDLSDPEDQARFDELAQKAGFSDTQLDPNDYSGYNNRPRIFGSVAEGEAAGFHLTNEPLVDDITRYVQGASLRVGDQALAKSFNEAMGANADRNMQFNVREGVNMGVSKEALKELQGYTQRDEPNKIHSMYRTANRKLKQTILSISLYHPNNINFFQVFPTLVGKGHPVLAFKALGGSYAALISKGLVTHEVEAALNDGTLEGAARIGTPIRWGSDYAEAGKVRIGKEGFGERAVFEQSVPYAHIQMARAVLNDLTKRGVDIDSPEARQAGLVVNKIMGFMNREVENGNPHVQGLVSDVFFAPQFTRSKWGVMKAALKPDVSVAANYARSAVLGKYLMQVGVALAAGAIEGQKTDNVKDLFLRNLVAPSIPLPSKNSQGTNNELSMPQNFISEGLSLGATLQRGSDGHLGLSFNPTQIPNNIAQYGRNRLAVVPSTGLKIATNTSFGNTPLYDRQAPAGTKAVQIATNAANGVLPISLQGAATTKIAKDILPGSVNQAIKVENPNSSMGSSIASSFGFTPKADKTTGYALKTQQYFNTSGQLENDLRSGNLSAISKSLQNVTPQEGQYLMNEYNALHPGNTKDLTTGMSIPKDWNALSNEQKASYYLANNQKTGQQVLSPLYAIDQKLTEMDPTRPHDPLFDLTGNGIGVDGKAAPKAQVALNYTNMTTGDPQRSVLLAANPWLSDYETKVGNYSQNYTQDMTSYLQKNGWSNDAIKTYFTQHPSNTPPVQPPTFDANTQSLMNQYAAITDPTAKSQFYSQNADALSNAFDQEAAYVNTKRLSSGELALQGYPTETPQVKALLDSMPTGTDSASKKARSQIINGNPAVNQYLADVSLYDTTKNLSEDNYVDPARPTDNEGQLLNDGTKQAQSTLKDISSLGAYDIAKDANGNYQFMQNGTFANGATSGSSSSSSKSNPFVPGPRKPYQKHTKIRKPYLAHAKSVRVKHTKPVKYGSVKIQHGPEFRASTGIRAA